MTGSETGTELLHQHEPLHRKPRNRTRSSRPRQLDPDEQLSLIKLALKWADIWWQCQDQKVVALAFEEKHDWRLKSVRSELLDLEMKWRSGKALGSVPSYRAICSSG
jgi:hypothetical protein